MRIFVLLCLITFFCSCKQKQKVVYPLPGSYLVKDIKRIGGYQHQDSLYIIQAERHDSTFYILKRDYMLKQYNNKDKKIQTDTYYVFNLTRIPESAKSKIEHKGYPSGWDHLIHFEGATFMLKHKEITSSYTTSQLKGLYYAP